MVKIAQHPLFPLSLLLVFLLGISFIPPRSLESGFVTGLIGTSLLSVLSWSVIKKVCS